MLDKQAFEELSDAVQGLVGDRREEFTFLSIQKRSSPWWTALMAVLSSTKIRSALASNACCTLIVMLARAQLLFSTALCSVTVPPAVLYHYVSLPCAPLRCALYHCN